MPTALENFKVNAIDIVDKGAQGEQARVALYKRHEQRGSLSRSEFQNLSPEQKKNYKWDEDRGKYVPVTKSQGDFHTDGSNSYSVTNDNKEQNMPENEELTKEEALEKVSELQDKVDELTSELEKANEPVDDDQGSDDISKRDDVPEDVREILRKQEERLEKAEKVAKAERDMRLEREERERVAKLNNLSLDVNEVAPLMKRVRDTDEDLAEEVMKTLRGLNEQIETSELFKEFGNDSPAEGSAEAKIEKAAQKILKDDPDISAAEAEALAVEQNPSLYSDYIREQGA